MAAGEHRSGGLAPPAAEASPSHTRLVLLAILSSERLQSQKVIRGMVENSAGLRWRRVYHSTPVGTTQLCKWLSKPIEQSDVMRGAQGLMLRFSFMEHVLRAERVVNFLEKFRAGLKTHLSGLESYARTNGKQMPLSRRLALGSGIRGYRGMYDWTAYALRAYRQWFTSQPKSPIDTAKGGL